MLKSDPKIFLVIYVSKFSTLNGGTFLYDAVLTILAEIESSPESHQLQEQFLLPTDPHILADVNLFFTYC